MEAVFTPCNIGTCRIKNRFVMTAANLGWCDDGYVTDKVIAFYRQRARGQIGLIIAGAAGVDPVRVNQAGMMQIYDDRFLPSMKRLTMEVHKEGSKIFLQLMHAGAYARPEEHGGQEAVAPSSYFCRFTRSQTKELTKEEIRQIIGYFKDGAKRAKAAGFDGIELIGSAGYLIAEFLSNATNHRQDEYGGSLENRSRILLEILQEIRKAVGKDYPVIVRLSGSEFVGTRTQKKKQHIEFLKVGKMLEADADGIDLTGGWHESSVPQITYNVPEGMYLYFAKAMKEQVDIPVIGCNRMNAHTAKEAVEKGYCDFAGMLRSFIADPFLVKKYMEGKEMQIRPCLSCNQQCLDQIFSGKGLACAVNPFAGREAKSGKTKENRRILVIGAGISGMVYAKLLADTNQITIWEQSMTYGGTAAAVARIPDQQAVRTYIDYLYRQCILKKVQFVWGKKAEQEELNDLLEEGVFDKIVIAAGSSRRPFYKKESSGKEMESWQEEESPGDGTHSFQNEKPPLYSISEEAQVMTPEECLLSQKLPGRRIVLIGGSYKAVQTALYCTEALKAGDAEQTFLERYAPEYVTFASNIMHWEDSTITLLSPDRQAGRGFGKSTRWMMLNEIKEKGVTVETEVRIQKITKDQVIYQVGGQEKTIPADLVILSEGWEKNREFILDQTGDDRPTGEPSVSKLYSGQLPDLTDRVSIIGDAKRPGRISEAVKDAFEAAII